MVPVSRKGRGEKNATHVGVRVGRRRSGSACEGGRRPQGLRASIPSPPLAADRPRGVGEGRARFLVCRSRSHAPVGRDRRAGRVGKGNHPLCVTPQFNRPRASRRAARALGSCVARHILGDDRTHYAAFIVDAMDELAARAVVPLTTAPATVTPISPARRAYFMFGSLGYWHMIPGAPVGSIEERASALLKMWWAQRICGTRPRQARGQLYIAKALALELAVAGRKFREGLGRTTSRISCGRSCQNGPNVARMPAVFSGEHAGPGNARANRRREA